MADQAQQAGGEFTPDDTLPDNSKQIMDVFGLEGDWDAAKTAAEANLSGQGSVDGEAPPSPAPAAEGGEAAPSPAPPAAATPAPKDVGASQQPQQGQPGAPAPSTPAVPAPTPAPQVSPEVQTLQAQVQALTQMLEQRSAQPAGQPGASASSPSGDQPQELPTPEQLMDYRVGIPPDVLQAIGSEDANVQAAGLTHLVNSFGKVVHSRVMAHVDQIVAQRLNDYDRGSRMSREQAQMQSDYYGAFPAHGDPLNRLVVGQEAQAMCQENPALQWNEETRNALGARVNARLGTVQQQQQQQEELVAATPAPAKPAAQMGATNRPGGNGRASVGEDITSILTAHM